MVNDLLAKQDEIKKNRRGGTQGMHPNSRANLSKPGQTNNPAGPPKDRGITSVQREMLDTPCPYDNHLPQRNWREWLAEKGLILASNREMALEHLKERLEGKVALPVKLEGEGIKVTLIRKAIGGRKEDNDGV